MNRESGNTLGISVLIAVIVKKGLGSKIVATAKKTGAEGGTIVLGRGTAEKSIYESILGIEFEPEKEIIFIVVEDKQEEDVLNAVIEEGELDKPGRGIGFVLDLKKCSGIAHLLQML